MRRTYPYFDLSMDPAYPLFDREMLVNTVNQEIFSPRSQVIPVSYLRQVENKNHLEDKVAMLLLLNVTMGNQNKPIHLASYTNSNQKRIKTSQTVQSYNRFFLFADLANPPFCTVVITRTVPESSFLLKENGGDTFVGRPYIINEPPHTTQTLNNTNTVVLPSTDLTLYPLDSVPDLDLDGTEDQMSYPREVGEYHYYVLKHKTVNLHRVQLATNVSCTGIECDRQKRRGECTCLHNTSSNSFVYMFDVEFPIPLRMQRGDAQMWTTPNFRSLRTTELFFRDFESHASQTTIEDEQANRQDFRHKIARMTRYINDHGGWTIIGWYMLGATADTNTTNVQDNKVENYDMHMHINYLYPTMYRARIEHDLAFQRMKIGAIVPERRPPRNVDQNDDIDIQDSDDDDILVRAED